MAKKEKTIYEENLITVRDELVGLLYADLKMSITDIAKIFNVSKQRINQIIKTNI